MDTLCEASPASLFLLLREKIKQLFTTITWYNIYIMAAISIEYSITFNAVLLDNAEKNLSNPLLSLGASAFQYDISFAYANSLSFFIRSATESGTTLTSFFLL